MPLNRTTVAALGAGALALAAAACAQTGDAAQSLRDRVAGPVGPAPDTTANITAADLGARIAIVSDDRFEGRAPSSDGGMLASQWIAEEMARIGLEPAGDDGTYFQAVPLVESSLDVENSSLTLSSNGEALDLENGADYVYWTKRTEGEVSFEDSELVFVGYGIVAPEYGWNDYEGVDVRGRTVVMLVNDPGFESGDPDLFNGHAMTYYGRWTYKFEEAARQGATGAIIIHEDAPASYPWQVVQFSWSGAQFDLEREDGGASRTAMEGWVTRAVGRRLFEEAGLDFGEMRRAAREPGFRPVVMEGLTASGVLQTNVSHLESRNVLGVLPGAERPDEHVLYTAHWDHLGMRDVPEGEDAIFNGAVDNATGVSTILEIAEAFAGGERPERSVLFAAVTAEESGLLGSAYFAAHPTVPLNTIVAGMNIDGQLPVGRTRDVVVIGYGASELEDILEEEAAAQDRVIRPDPEPEAGYFYRSDHVELAKVGVPMLYADGGQDHRELGVEYGERVAAEYRANAYHKPADEYSEDWDLSGMEEDATLLFNIGMRIADTDIWPNWYETNEFRAIRDASMAGE